jgi:hypothetical protein
MKVSKLSLTLPLALLFAACGGDADDADIVLDDMDEPTAEQGMPPTVEAPPAAPAMPMTAQLQPLQDSGVTGEVTVTGRDAQTEVTVRLAGGTPSESHPGHIHSGTCDAVGGVVQPLQPIAADATGSGTMTTTVAVPAATAMNGQHIVVYHAPGGQPVTCAQIPAHAM